MIKIGIVPSHPFGHSLGTDVRLVNLVSSLSKLDTEIHFITPFRSDLLPKSENVYVHAPAGLLSNPWLNERVYRTTRTLFSRPFWSRNFVCREFVLNKMVNSFAGKIFKPAQNLDLDIILGELEIASMACIKLRESLGIPVIADIHGTWSEETIAAKIIEESSPQANTMRRFERKILQGADAVIAVSEDAKIFFDESYDVSPDKVTVIPCGAIPRVCEAKMVKHPSRIVSSGMITHREHADLFVRSMPLVLSKYPSARFYITKKGDKLGEIMKLADSMGVHPELFYYPALSDAYFSFIQDCHIGVLTSSHDTPRKIAYPAKLFDYMSIGLPVVANDVGTWTRIITDHKVGIVTEDSPRDFASALLHLLENPDDMYECGQRGIELVKTRFNHDTLAKTLYALLEKMTQ
jgi:glycosyltransferase involved in cell wall biosynthesis